MARSRTLLRVRVPVEQAFAFVSDFRNAPLWDPQARSVEKLSDGEIRVGTRFTMVATLLGRRLELPYEIVALERPHRLVLAGATRLFRYRDEIGFAAEGDHTVLDYDSELLLRAAPNFLDGALELAFVRIGRIATRGMAAAIESHA